MCTPLFIPSYHDSDHKPHHVLFKVTNRTKIMPLNHASTSKLTINATFLALEIFVQNAHLLVDNSHEEYGDKIIKILVKLTRIVKTKAGLKC